MRDEVNAVLQRAADCAIDYFANNVRVSNLVVDNKAQAGFDPVTEADRAVEKLIRDELKQLYGSEVVVYGEETGFGGDAQAEGVSTNNDDGLNPAALKDLEKLDECWVVDPIDGTRAFVSGQPMWGTVLGYVQNARVSKGWISMPVLDEIYCSDGESSFVSLGRRSALYCLADDCVADDRGLDTVGDCALDPSLPTSLPKTGTSNGNELRQLSCSSVHELGQATLATTHPSMFLGTEYDAAHKKLDSVSKTTRYAGDCYNYALLASGCIDLVVENGLAPYDIIGAIPVVRNAGGVITNLNGESPESGGLVIAAATEELHAKAMAVFR